MTCDPSHLVKRHPGGRPREWDRDQILRELEDWVKKDDSVNLNKFCGTREPMLDPAKLSQWAGECEEFRKSYRAAKTLLAARREEWLSSERLHQKAYHLSVNSYNYFDKEESREEYAYQKEVDAKVGKDIANAANEDVKDRLDKTLGQLSSLQDSLKNAKTSNKSDS
jgi:hypothetical protein